MRGVLPDTSLANKGLAGTAEELLLRATSASAAFGFAVARSLDRSHKHVLSAWFAAALKVLSVTVAHRVGQLRLEADRSQAAMLV